MLGMTSKESIGIETALLVFTPSGLRGRFEKGTSVLLAAQSLGVDLESACGGRGLCSRCQVSPSFGQFAKHNIIAFESNLSEESEFETKRKRIMKVSPDRRLGCRALIQGDMVIDVPEASQLHQQHITKDAVQVGVDLDPATKLVVVTVEKPSLKESSSDFFRLTRAIESEFGIVISHCDYSVLTELQDSLHKGDWTVTVAIYDETIVQAVWPGFKDAIFGLVVDLGSTTIVAHLCNLGTGTIISSSAVMNPQIRFGEDLMSRVSYVMMNPGGDAEMTRAVRQSFNELAKDACKKAEMGTQDILEMVVVGNPIMHHLFLGIDPTPLGSAPFALATEAMQLIKSSELGIDLHSEARVCVLPCIAGHIGADTAAMILAERPWESDKTVLLVDIGTNAEIVLGSKDRLLAASSPTGPAFEGAQISCGQRAAKGAIEHVRIDPTTYSARVKVIGSDLWSDEDGFAEATKKTGVTGICGSGIIEAISQMYLAGIINQDGVITTEISKDTPHIVSDGRTQSYILYSAGEQLLKITQNDVRSIQLAKAALYAGIKLLMNHMNITRPDKICIAGAFGSHIDVKSAMVLGLIPDCDLNNVASIGNAAGTGATIALLDKKTRPEIQAVLKTVEKIETAIESDFQRFFVDAMAIPHKTDSFNNLGKSVILPGTFLIPKPGNAESKRCRRRKRRSS